jgi:type IV pilus assembly protein PilC
MPKYSYKATSLKGDVETGIFEAQSVQDLSHYLKERGYILIKADLAEDSKKRSLTSLFGHFNFSRFLGSGKVKLKEKIFFARNLKVMIASGISLPRALNVISSQTKNKRFKKVLSEISEKVTKGEDFAKALSYYPDIFPEIFVSMIEAGEESGTLEDVLEGLAYQMEKDQDLRSKIVGAMIYPIVILVAMIGIGIIMLVWVIPKLSGVFKDLNVELPITTRIVIGTGNFLAERWYFGLIILFGIFVFLRFFLSLPKGKRMMSGLVLKIPLISSIVEKTNSARTARVLSSLIRAGVPIVRSLEILQKTLGNFYFRKVVEQSIDKVRKGEKIYDALKSEKQVYPSLVLEMLKIGEETGETASILAKLADFYEEEVSNITKNMSSIIEPVLMIIIGIFVGFFVISMVQPMYSIMQGLQ